MYAITRILKSIEYAYYFFGFPSYSLYSFFLNRLYFAPVLVIYTTVLAETAKTMPAIRAAKTKTQTLRFFIIQSPFRNGGKFSFPCLVRP
jgi:hypothetical protein